MGGTVAGFLDHLVHVAAAATRRGGGDQAACSRAACCRPRAGRTSVKSRRNVRRLPIFTDTHRWYFRNRSRTYEFKEQDDAHPIRRQRTRLGVVERLEWFVLRATKRTVIALTFSPDSYYHRASRSRAYCVQRRRHLQAHRARRCPESRRPGRKPLPPLRSETQQEYEPKKDKPPRIKNITYTRAEATRQGCRHYWSAVCTLSELIHCKLRRHSIYFK